MGLRVLFGQSPRVNRCRQMILDTSIVTTFAA